MFSNYFKTAWRNLKKNKFYSAINISGLTVGLAIGILILLWVQDELSFDRFHSKTASIYKLENMVGTGPGRQIWSNTAAPIGLLGKKELPGVKDVARLTFNGYYSLFNYNDKVFNEKSNFFVDPAFFSIFDFNLIKGDNRNPFPDNNSIVITEKIAKKYFGSEEPLGKVISTDTKENFKVTGVIADIPLQSTIQADMFFPMSLLSYKMYAGNTKGESMEHDFNQYMYNTFFVMDEAAVNKQFTTKLRDVHLRNKADDTDIEYLLLPLSKLHLYKSDGSDAGIGTVKMFSIIALLILIIACINYINLSTARSMLRAREVSIRKIVGAGKSGLFLQFIIETALLFVFATILSLALIYFVLPYFNQFSGKQLSLNLKDYKVWMVIAATIIGSLVVSSIYPAILLSSFEPLKALKGKISAKLSSVIFRRVLVVTQFSFSIVLIAGTLIIGNQLSYIRSKNLGYDKSHTLSFQTKEIAGHYEAVKAELLKQKGVVDVTASSANIVRIGGQTGDNEWDGKEKGETLMLSPLAVDKNFLSFFKMEMKEGSFFTGSPSDSAHFILNETAVKAARLMDPIGKKFRLRGVTGTIIGVIKDFHFASMKRKIDPAIFTYDPKNASQIYIKTSGQDAPFAIAAAGKQWKTYNAGFDFEYAFLDDTFNRLYQFEDKTATLFNLFASVAILICCLGLLGLATYTAQTRTREIGVRKVLGASSVGIIRLLAFDFGKLVLLAIIIAIPVCWYVMHKWLEDFAYKTNISWTVFLAAGSIAIVVAIVTISFQTIKAALANPVKSLRSE